MATSAFRSSSRRGNTSSGGSEKVPIIRRSHSVSAVPRAQNNNHSDHRRHNQVDSSSSFEEFLNKRDNPLFWSSSWSSTTASGSPPDKEKEMEHPPGQGNGIRTQFAAETEKVVVCAGGSVLTSSETGSRGRSVTRNVVTSAKKLAAAGTTTTATAAAAPTNFSRGGVDTTGRRCRSVSRGRAPYAASESELERESVVPSNYPNKSSSNVAAAANSLKKKANLGRNAAHKRTESTSTEYQAMEPSHNSSSYLQIPNWEDEIYTGSLSAEAEEKTIKAVCEQMKSFQGDHMGAGDITANGIYETVRSEVRRAISDIQNDLESALRRNNATAIAATNVADIPPDLVNPGAVELVLDIRREYARKFEESQERARKLRADLAVEEQRGQELSRILKEILPDPKTTNVQKSRPGRKNSSERKKMSKRLTEEAMTYFDECVSISTFDSSDFSATEDPPLNSIGATSPVGGTTASLAQGSPSVSISYCSNSCLNHKQDSGGRGLILHSHLDSGLTARSSSNESMINQASLRGNNAEWGRKLQFSFSQKPTENFGLQQDIRHYIKQNIEKEFDKDGINSENLRSTYYAIDEYLHGRAEGCLFDRVFLKNRIDSGSLHICGGGLAVAFSSFSSVI